MTVENVKQAFTRVMNSLVLDGLDLMDDDIRLFAVNKSRKSGHIRLLRRFEQNISSKSLHIRFAYRIDLFASICYNNIKMPPKGYQFYG